MKSDLITLSKLEMQTVGEALEHPERSLSEVIPRDIAPDKCVAIMKVSVAIYARGDQKMSHLASIMGRGLAVMRVRPDILEASGYKTLKEFEDAEIIAKGIGTHGPIWDRKKIYETWPDLSVVQVEEIGVTKLKKGAKALPKDASDGQRKDVLRAAKTAHTVQEMETALVNRGLAEPGGTTKDSFTLIGPSNEIEELREILADQRFIAWTENAPGSLEMILCALRSTRAEWDHGEDVPMGTAADGAW